MFKAWKINKEFIVRITDFDKNEENELGIKELSVIYRKLFSSDEGKIVLDDLARASGILQSNFSCETNQMYFLEGKRNLFFYIVSYLRNERESNKREEFDDIFKF
jgi:hypothetical protein